MTKDLQELIKIIKSKALTEEEKVEQIQAILSENPELANAAYNNVWLPLCIAAAKGHSELVKALLAIKGINVNLAESNGMTPLLYAINKDHLEIVRLLLAREEIDVNLARDGWKPLIAASWKGNLEIVKELLKHGANVNATDNRGRTPLFAAANRGHLEIAQLLLAREGIDVNFANSFCEAPLYIASREGHLEVVKALIEHGANVNAVNNSNLTPLLVASQEGHLEVVKALLAIKGIDVNAVDDYGRTPLFAAANRGHSEIAQLIIEHMLTRNKTKPDFLSGELLNHWTKCTTEIEEMQKYTIGNMSKKKISLYDLFAENDLNQLALYMSNENIVETLNTNGYKDLIYASKIEDQYKKGMERNSVLNEAINYVNDTQFRSEAPLPSHVLRKIFEELSNEKLKRIVPHCGELTSEKEAQNPAAPQQSVEADKTVSSDLSDVRMKEHDRCVIL